jgi:predicted AAA+ superfamily ATPase
LLSGRDIPIEVFPLSFNEFLDFNKISIKSLEEALVNKSSLIKNLREYLEYGGFPEVAIEKN